MKRCSNCGIEKVDSCFYKRRKSLKSKSHQSVCKECEKSRNKQRKIYFSDYNKTHKEERKKYQNERREHLKELQRIRDHELKWKFIQLKGGKCTNPKCGIIATRENICIFDFHHPEPIGKSKNKRRGKENPHSKNFALDEVILFCANCHRLEEQCPLFRE